MQRSRARARASEREREREREKGGKKNKGGLGLHNMLRLFLVCFLAPVLCADCWWWIVQQKGKVTTNVGGGEREAEQQQQQNFNGLQQESRALSNQHKKKAFHVRDIQTCSIGSPWIGPVRFRPLMPSLTKLCKVAPGKKEKE